MPLPSVSQLVQIGWRKIMMLCVLLENLLPKLGQRQAVSIIANSGYGLLVRQIIIKQKKIECPMGDVVVTVRYVSSVESSLSPLSYLHPGEGGIPSINQFI